MSRMGSVPLNVYMFGGEGRKIMWSHVVKRFRTSPAKSHPPPKNFLTARGKILSKKRPTRDSRPSDGSLAVQP